MTAHHSLSDADVDAIEARARMDGEYTLVEVLDLCAALRRTRAALAAACFPASECERGD